MLHTNRRRRWYLQRRLLMAITGVLLLAGAIYMESRAFPAAVDHARKVAGGRRAKVSQARLLAQSRAARKVYPYSVIRGGVFDGGELIQALDSDPVAAQHYAGFRHSQVHTIQAAFTKPVYLSYRISNVIYWTSRPVRIPLGETLLTDGTNYARARCGNRISDTAQAPVSDVEPEESTLDQPKLPAETQTAAPESWSETRLVTELSPPFAIIVPANGAPGSAVPVPGQSPSSDETASWFSIGTPTGFLAIWDVAGKLSPNPPPLPGANPIDITQTPTSPGLVFITPPGASETPFPGGPASTPTSFPPASPPVLVPPTVAYVPPLLFPPGTVPPVVFPPGTVPPLPLPSGTVLPFWPPNVPLYPGLPVTDLPPGTGGPNSPPGTTVVPISPNLPQLPVTPVPEPRLLPPALLAGLAVWAAARARNKKPRP